MGKRKSYIELNLTSGKTIHIKTNAILFIAEKGTGSELGVSFQIIRVVESPSEVRELMKGD